MLIANVVRPAGEWRDPRHRRGLAGELAAARYLIANGWSIEAHRFRVGHHDLDLIARQRDLVAFIEVKTRSPSRFGDGREAVGARKRAILELVAAVWLARRGRAGERYRFDVMLVGRGPVGSTFPQVAHIPDAWRRVEK
ncbi:MAG: YraN family protein [Gemmatimonadales bacterium]